MLHRFYRNLFNVLLAFLFFAGNTHAQETDEGMGIYHSLKGAIDAHRGLLKRQFRSYRKLSTSEVRSLRKYRLHPSYLRSVVLHSPQRFYDILDNKRTCQIYDYLLNNLLRGEPEISDILVFQNEKYGNFVVDREEFKEITFKRDCAQEYQKFLFFKSSALPSFLNSVNFQTPTTQSECFQVFDEWQKNQYVPNFCSLTQVDEIRNQLIVQRNNLSTTDVDGLREINLLLDENSRLKRAVPISTATYLNNLCQHMDNKNKFCKLYISPHVWHKVVLGERPEYLMSYRCKDFGSKLNVSACRQKLLKDPTQCYLKGVDNFPALVPKEDCNMQSFLLNQSRLVTKYRDCPAFVNNGSIINISRIYSHFYPNEDEPPGDECNNVALRNFAKMNLDYKNETAWPMQICYFDKIENDKVCKTFVPGSEDTENSETRVVSDIVKKLRPAPDDLKCEKVSTRSFRPGRLKYKVGCFIVYDFINCTLEQCPKKIYLEAKEVEGIEFVGKPNIHYFDDSFINPRYTQLKLLEREFKIRKKQLVNFTVLRSFLNQSPKNIVHGIACMELLLPRMYASRGFNQCTPEAFIVDDLLEIEGKKFVIARTAVDDVHSPRLIWWHNVFHAVKKYQELHPSKPWTMYGAYLEN